MKPEWDLVNSRALWFPFGSGLMECGYPANLFLDLQWQLMVKIMAEPLVFSLGKVINVVSAYPLSQIVLT